ncbi:MAG: ATP-binding protein [Pseudomonadota bacterium]|nr:ATP-binding protein [Pseudomonadota bacterium]
MKLCFFGPSGSGKSTAADIACSLLKNQYTVVRLDVATPLREIQNLSREVFNLPPAGSPDKPSSFASDGKLLSFLAEHYESQLPISFENRLNKSLETLQSSGAGPEKAVFINADCRDNCYETLKRLGFTFVKVYASESNRTIRRAIRGDISPYPASKIENISSMAHDEIVANNGHKMALRESVASLLRRLGLIKKKIKLSTDIGWIL